MKDSIKKIIIVISLLFVIVIFSLKILNEKESVKAVDDSFDVSPHSQFCNEAPNTKISQLKLEGVITGAEENFEYSYSYETSELPSFDEMRTHIKDAIVETCNSYTFPMSEDFVLKSAVWQPPVLPDVEGVPFLFYKNLNNAILKLIYRPAKREPFQDKTTCIEQPLFSAMDQIVFEVEEVFNADSKLLQQVSLVCVGQFESVDRWETSL